MYGGVPHALASSKSLDKEIFFTAVTESMGKMCKIYNLNRIRFRKITLTVKFNSKQLLLLLLR